MYKLRSKLFAYQEEDVQDISSMNGRVLLANEMGLGKSLTALTWMYTNNKLPAIVVCPASLKWNWAKEIEIHFKGDYEVLEGRSNRMTKARIFNPKTVWIINYDILQNWVEFLSSLKPQVIIFDEVHYLKSPKSKRTKNGKALGRSIPHCLALSGTPLTNRPAELFSILNIIKPKLFPSFYSYASEYCCLRKTPWGWDYSGARNLKKLHTILSTSCMIRRRKADVLDLPPKTREVVTLPIENEGEYLKAETDFLNWLKQEAPEKAKKAEKAERIIQLGHLKRLAAKLKLKYAIEWIDDFLEETEEKLLVFTAHKSIIKALEEKYKPICTKVDGSVTASKRQLAFDTFTKNPKCRVFLGNMQAAGVGWNATVATNVVFTELPWTPGELAQCEDRCHRIGATGSVLCTYLIGRGTIEEEICKLLQKKQQVLDTTLDGKPHKDSLDIYDQVTSTLIRKNK